MNFSIFICSCTARSIVTGSFDKSVKIWTSEAKLIHKLDGFSSSVLGLCYVPRNRTLWVAGGAQRAQLYDPRSGDDVSNAGASYTELYFAQSVA